MRNFSRFFDGAIYPFISFDFQGTDATHTCNLETSGSLEEDIETFNKNHPDLDLIIMPYAFPHSACGTPTREYLYNVTNMGIEKTRENKTIGVITYVLQKENISIDSFYDIIKRIYSKET